MIHNNFTEGPCGGRSHKMIDYCFDTPRDRNIHLWRHIFRRRDFAADGAANGILVGTVGWLGQELCVRLSTGITLFSVSLLGLSMFIKPQELSRSTQSTQSVHAGSSWIKLDHAVVSSLIGQADRLDLIEVEFCCAHGTSDTWQGFAKFRDCCTSSCTTRPRKGTEGKPWMLQMYGSFHSSHSNTAKGFLWAPHFLKPWWLGNPWDVGSWWSNYFQKSLGLWAVAIQVRAEAM